MNMKNFTAAALAVALGMAQAAPLYATSVPGHPALDTLPNCADVSLRARCRVDVPNGDFGGKPGDNFYHGTFSWTGIIGATHSTRAHLAPWSYLHEQGTRPHLDEPALSSKLLLRSPGDLVFQWLDLTPERYVDTVFTVHAHVASVRGSATAAIHIRAPGSDEDIATTEEADTVPRNKPRDELVASITVPAGWTGTRIGVAVAAMEGAAGVEVDDVFVVRTPVGDSLPELVPVW